MTYIRFFFVFYWFAPFLKFGPLPSENLRCAPVYVTLMNDFDKIFVLAFYNSFLKIKLNCDKENTLHLN